MRLHQVLPAVALALVVSARLAGSAAAQGPDGLAPAPPVTSPGRPDAPAPNTPNPNPSTPGSGQPAAPASVQAPAPAPPRPPDTSATRVAQPAPADGRVDAAPTVSNRDKPDNTRAGERPAGTVATVQPTEAPPVPAARSANPPAPINQVPAPPAIATPPGEPAGQVPATPEPSPATADSIARPASVIADLGSPAVVSPAQPTVGGDQATARDAPVLAEVARPLQTGADPRPLDLDAAVNTLSDQSVAPVEELSAAAIDRFDGPIEIAIAVIEPTLPDIDPSRAVAWNELPELPVDAPIVDLADTAPVDALASEALGLAARAPDVAAPPALLLDGLTPDLRTVEAPAAGALPTDSTRGPVIGDLGNLSDRPLATAPVPANARRLPDQATEAPHGDDPIGSTAVPDANRPGGAVVAVPAPWPVRTAPDSTEQPIAITADAAPADTGPRAATPAGAEWVPAARPPDGAGPRPLPGRTRIHGHPAPEPAGPGSALDAPAPRHPRPAPGSPFPAAAATFLATTSSGSGGAGFWIILTSPLAALVLAFFHLGARPALSRPPGAGRAVPVPPG